MADFKVNISFEGKQGLTTPPAKEFPSSVTIGGLIDRVKKVKTLGLLPQQQLLMCVMNGTDTFMPAPDQTVGDLFKMFSVDDPQIGKCLKIAMCTSLYQG